MTVSKILNSYLYFAGTKELQQIISRNCPKANTVPRVLAKLSLTLKKPLKLMELKCPMVKASNNVVWSKLTYSTTNIL